MYKVRNPVSIISGEGSINQLNNVLKRGVGKSILLTSPGMTKRGVVKTIVDNCKTPLYIYDKIKPNPTIADLSQYLRDVLNKEFLEGRAIDNLIALGGGSVIDVAKSIAIIDSFDIASDKLQEQCIRSYFEKNKPFAESNFDRRYYNLIAIPTTAGTGSEVTCWATAWDEKKKYSLQHQLMYPDYAILDPNLTHSLPYDTTVFSALDAFSQALESLWNKNATPYSDALAQEALKILSSAFRSEFQYNKYKSADTRKKLQEGSLLSGLAFSQTKTSLAHSMSYPLTYEYGIPHGLACSFTLAEIYRICVDKFWTNDSHDSFIYNRIIKISSAISPEESQSVEIEQDFYHIFKNLKVPSHIKKYRLTKNKINKIKDQFINPSRAGNFIIDVTNEQAADIIMRSLQNLKRY